ncbi:MAG: hypothetical protein HY294_17695 [Candidatus Rokubacteria bacterium]|nr:hypothetical protein [Candidatus Rokubacteria bacterium]MBI3827825.1 hypothetical protein [Candidatus Rokubacteria bacterium]
MKKRSRVRLPRFASEREAARFWSATDSTPYAKGLKEVRVSATRAVKARVRRRAAAKTPITIRLESGQIEKAKRLARTRSIGYQTMLRMWIAERLARERAG